MPLTDKELTGSKGFSVLMANSLMFQRFPTHNGYEDPQLANFYGQALPLLKRGVPVKTVHIENLGYKEALADTKVLLMTYANMKPLEPEAHSHIADWVKKGGVLIYVAHTLFKHSSQVVISPLQIEVVFELQLSRFRVLLAKRINPGEQALLLNVERVAGKKKPQVLASASREEQEERGKRLVFLCGEKSCRDFKRIAGTVAELSEECDSRWQRSIRYQALACSKSYLFDRV